ncbi:MAG: alpha-amylase family glycosyl hydrolase, partial [Bryobacteraceae bacterium]
MKSWPSQPVVCEINTANWLHGLSRQYKTEITLGTVPAEELRRLAELQFDGIWLLGVWERSPEARKIAREHPGLQAEYRRALPDYGQDDVIGSPFAVHRYAVEPAFGSDEELSELRYRLHELDIGLILDFVPNHLARDHEWVAKSPEYLVEATFADFESRPDSYFMSEGRVFAHGRDPGFAAWTDTVQIDYRRPEARAAMTQLLTDLSQRSDGVRCDMAMLVTADIFCRTWGGRFEPPGADFWSTAIQSVKRVNPGFLMIAEVYWDLEYDLLQQGFDYAYDKRLYDRLKGDEPEEIRRHLFASADYQRHLVRFIENHDEDRAAAVFGEERGEAAAALGLTLPGLRLLEDGQMEGRVTRLPVQLAHGPEEAANPRLGDFYRRLLAALHLPAFHEGSWHLLQAREAWSGNPTYGSFVTHCWARGEDFILIAANFSSGSAQCYIPLEVPALTGCKWELRDLLSDAIYEREGDAMLHPGLYLDVPAWGKHIFQFHLKARELSAGIHHRSTLHVADKQIYAMSWSPDGRSMALSGSGNRISIVDVATGASIRELVGHHSLVGALAWCPADHALASGSDDREVRVWDLDTGRTLHVFSGHQDHVLTLCWSPNGRLIASGGIDRRIFVWDVKGGRPPVSFGRQADAVNCVSWSHNGKRIAAGSGDQTVHIWDASVPGIPEFVFEMTARDWVSSVAWSPDDKTIASGTGRGAVNIWNAEAGRLTSILEGHTQRVLCVAFSPDGRLLTTKSADGSVRIWRADTWQEVGLISEAGEFLSGLAFPQKGSFLASRDDRENSIRIWDLDSDKILRDRPSRASVHYTSAKVVVAGNSGTGKSCLVNALLGKQFQPQPATHAMEIVLFQSDVVTGPGGAEVIREVLLWDLAGQADYHIVNQLFLDETALALVLFDGTDPENPFSGVRYWVKALQRFVSGRPRILVAGRTDRGKPSVSEAEVDEFRRSNGFCCYLPTSAMTRKGIEELSTAIAENIDWEDLPFVSSPELWNELRAYIVEERSRCPATTVRRLKESFEQTRRRSLTDEEFNRVIALAQIQGLAWRASFGEFLLLKPELLNWYASAIVRAAHNDGLGCLLERDVLAANIDFEDMQRVKDVGLERVLLHGVVELFLRKQIALLEGERLVFPSKFKRVRAPLASAALFEVSYTFQGPVEDVYATLVVRLFYGGAFELGQLWKNAAEFRDSLGHTCGFQLEYIEEGSSKLSVFYDAETPLESKLLFVKFIQEHLQSRAVAGSVQRRRIHRCPSCREEVEGRRAVDARLKRGQRTIPCQFCGSAIELIDILEEKFGDPDLLKFVRGLEGRADQRIGQAVAKTIY